MDFASSTVAFIIGFVLVAAYLWTRKPWAKKADDELVGLATGGDWKSWKDALAELRRRGHDLTPYVPAIAARLLAESRFEREAARITLADLFPAWQERLAACGYQPAEPPEQARARLQPVFASFQLPLP